MFLGSVFKSINFQNFKASLQYFIDFQISKQENANSIPIKTLLASLLPPIFASPYTFATRLRYEDREAKRPSKNVILIFHNAPLATASRSEGVKVA